MYVYIYVYMYKYICVCIYMCVYIYLLTDYLPAFTVTRKKEKKTARNKR